MRFLFCLITLIVAGSVSCTNSSYITLTPLTLNTTFDTPTPLTLNTTFDTPTPLTLNTTFDTPTPLASDTAHYSFTILPETSETSETSDTVTEKPDLNDFDDLNIEELEFNQTFTLEFTNTNYLRMFFESYEGGYFSIQVNGTTIMANTTFYSNSLSSTLFDHNMTYQVIIIGNSGFKQHIIYALANSTDNVYMPLILGNSTSTFSYKIEKSASQVNINIKSYNNIAFSAYVTKENDTDDILSGKCQNVTECVKEQLSLNSKYQYILVIENSYNENQNQPNQIEYAIYYDNSSSSGGTSAVTIILAVILSLVVFTVFLVLVVIAAIVIRNKRRNSITTI